MLLSTPVVVVLTIAVAQAAVPVGSAITVVAIRYFLVFGLTTKTYLSYRIVFNILISIGILIT